MPTYNYFPTGYQPMQNYQTQVSQATPNVNNGGIVWVQGEAGAKAYPVAPNNSVLLMDSESSAFYIKSTDNSGMPLPLRIFEYSEKNVQQSTEKPQVSAVTDNDYVTREEFEQRLSQIQLKPKKKKVEVEVDDDE